MSNIQESLAAGREFFTPKKGETPHGNGALKPNSSPRRDLHFSKKYPPFGKRLAVQLSQGQRPQNVVWVACGIKAWDRARNDLKRSDSAALCLPHGSDPTAYRWPVAGLSCVVVHTGGLDAKTLRALGAELIKSGAILATLIGIEAELGAPIMSFKPGRVEL